MSERAQDRNKGSWRDPPKLHVDFGFGLGGCGLNWPLDRRPSPFFGCMFQRGGSGGLCSVFLFRSQTFLGDEALLFL